MHLYLLKFSSGKCYIGQTQRGMKVRMQHHRNQAANGSHLAVHCAWRKYGEPDISVIGLFPDVAALHAAEIAAIASYATLAPHGYNIGHGGETAPSKNPDVAAKISAKAKGRKQHSEEFKAARSRAMAQRMADPAYREKMRLANEAYWTEERRVAQAEKSRDMATGVKFSAARRANIGTANRNPSQGTRLKMSAAAKARGLNNHFTEASREKLAKATSTTWQNPEIRAKRSAAIRAGHAKRRIAKHGDKK